MSHTATLDYVTCASPAGLHRMAYRSWGDPGNPKVLLCVHGLTRTGLDFAPLAQALADEYLVVAPDIVGRGRSDWLIDPMQYVVPQYVADIVTLIARLRPQRLDWVGTSMGGLIGLGLAGAAMASALLRPQPKPWGLAPAPDIPLGRMVFNDIGPVIQRAALARIAQYVGEDKRPADFAQAVDYVRETSPGFGQFDQAGWQELSADVFHQQGTEWVKHYDLRLAAPFALQDSAALDAAEALLWQAWDGLGVPALVLRGAESDLLAPEVLAQMLARNRLARACEIPATGHAPMLRDAHQIAIVSDFLRAA